MSDKVNTIAQLKSRIERFRKARGWNPSRKNLAISISIEAAELLEHFQWDDWKSVENQTEIENELADIIIYCFEFANAGNIDITNAVVTKLGHNAKKYPAKAFRKNKNLSALYYAAKKKHRAKK